MSLSLFALSLAAQAASAPDCVYAAVPAGQRIAIGEAVLAKRTQDEAMLRELVKAVDACRPAGGWSTEGALHANGYAVMRIAADTLAGKLGHPSWSATALKVIRAQPSEQIANLASTESDTEIFKRVLTQMIAEDRSVGTSLNAASDAVFTNFILLVKMTAIAEGERRKI